MGRRLHANQESWGAHRGEGKDEGIKEKEEKSADFNTAICSGRVSHAASKVFPFSNVSFFFFVFSLILISAFFLVFSFFCNQIRCTFPSVDGVHVLYPILVYCTGNFKASEKLLSNLLFSQ